MARFNLFLIAFFSILGCSSESRQSTNENNITQEPKLTLETQALFRNLKEISKDGIMFGHQDAVAYGVGWIGGEFESDVQKVSGSYPAVFGWDIGHIDSTENIDNVPFTDMKNWMIEAYKRGGVNTISWHQRNPKTGESSWDVTPVVTDILPTGSLNSKFNNQLDKVAELIGSLVTEDGVKVPVIFRPYHEHNGSWFWWGETPCPDSLYIELFRYTVNYLRINKGLKNILFCYSTDAFETKDDYLERYPGDEYVDIFGFDDYKSIRTPDTRDVLINRLKIVDELAKKRNKVAILSETGYETLSMHDWFSEVLLKGIKASQANIAYVLVWRNARTDHHYAPFPGHPSVDSFLDFKNDSSTFFLNDLPSMYQ